MARKPSDKRAPVGRFGGVRMVQRRIGRSETLYQNKEVVAAELLMVATSSITDIVNLDGSLKPLDEIPEHALRAIKKITPTKDGVSIEMHDKVATLRVLAKASGLLDAEANQEKPSIVGINMRGPVLDVEAKEDSGYGEEEREDDGGVAAADDPAEDESEGVGAAVWQERDDHQGDDRR